MTSGETPEPHKQLHEENIEDLQPPSILDMPATTPAGSSNDQGTKLAVESTGQGPSSSDGSSRGCMHYIQPLTRGFSQKSLRKITIFSVPGSEAKVVPLVVNDQIGGRKVITFNPMIPKGKGKGKGNGCGSVMPSSPSQALPLISHFQNGHLICLPKNVNSTGENLASTMTTTTTARNSPLAPETPDKCLRAEETMHGEGMSRSSADEPVVEQGKPSCQQSDVPPPRVESSQKTNVDQAEQGVELIKTPQQKPIRKRHRPKVIREDKPSKALKLAAPMVLTPEPDRNVKNRVKRKYTRKKLNVQGSDTPSTAVHEITGQNCSITPEKSLDQNYKDSTTCVKRKYVRKKILQNDEDFSSDMASEKIGLHNMNLTAKTPEKNEGLGQAKRKYVRKKKCSDDSEIPTDASGTGNLCVSNDSKEPHITRSARRCLNFDLEGQTQTSCIVSVINHGKSQGQEPTCIKTNSKSTVQFDPGFKVVVENTPAGAAYNLNCSLNKMLEEYIELPEKTTSNVANGIGEKSVENSEDVVNESEELSCTPDKDNVLQLELQDGENIIPEVRLPENVIEMKVAKRGPANDIQYHGPLFPIIHKKRRTSQKDHKAISARTYPRFQLYTIANLAQLMTVEKSQDKGCILRFDQIEVTTKKRSKMPTRARNSYSLAAIAETLSTATCLKKRSKRSAVRTLQEKNLHHIEISYIYDSHSCGKYQKSLCSNLISQAMVPYVDPVEDIVQKFKYLDINREFKEQEALTLCAGGGIIVPISGPFELAPTQRPRPKVDLDSESERVWNLLMGKEGKDEPDILNKNKDKWWADERRVFHGRVDSFIARMHLVQGDRRFSQWKGSVVDSVVGVFLTQNVSDHLSSSAFMALAARFPFQSENEVLELNAENWCKSIIQQDKCVQPFDYMTRHGKMSIPEVSDQISIQIQEADHMEEKMANGEKLVRNNSEGEMEDLHPYEKDIEVGNNIPDERTGTTEIIADGNSLAKDEDRYPMTSHSQVPSSSDANSQPELMIGSRCCCLENFSFMELLHIQDTTEICRHCMHNNKSVPSTENCRQIYAQAQNETIPTLDEVDGPKWAWTAKHKPNIDPDHNCMGMPCTSMLCDLGTLSECGKENKSHFSSDDDVFDGPKFMGTKEKLCGHSTEYSIEATVDMQKKRVADLRLQSHAVEVPPTTKEQQNEMHEICANSCNNPMMQKSAVEKEAEVYLTNESHSSEKVPLETSDNSSNVEKGVQSDSKDGNDSSQQAPLETENKASRGKKAKFVRNTNKTFDWDRLRKQVSSNKKERERASNTMDTLDWESVRCADVNEISQTIRGRGMNNVLAGRIQEFLNRLVGEHGSIDLEWLRDIEPDEAKNYLLSIRGLGLKSVECVRLLTLHHLAFPVDTNVGRICVRLGWVPLQPLPESLQLHLLELYPVLETIQKYLWPRLCTLDQRTLYELHYQMITFGKVFCTKSKPNCNSCPMRGECKHFASAFASARLALPAGEEKSLVSSEIPTASEIDQCLVLNSRLLPHLEGGQSLQQGTTLNNCEPIVEEPLTPEPESSEALESEIEDAFYEDPDEIPTIKLNLKEFTQNLRDVMQANDLDLRDNELSKALVTISPDAASIPMPKLKNVSRLRTEHQVYELPDAHPLLEEVDQREHDDPSPYLLAIWAPGETAESAQPPEICCNSQDTGELCNKEVCFACNSIREARAQTVRATLLIPCRTAMRGSFPLNGTYFQVNEVFADHASSCNPINVPRGWIWNLPRRTVYFGTSVTTIFKGLRTEEIQQCFWKGFVCVRGFDRKSRAPRPLYARLHFPPSKAVRKGKKPVNEE
ncbi:Uracil-DNA glycosylase protein [Dioscorea alata]|uniref:Uracil-DNA glycosylase protein n=1 Tax=Dioscorea alata TaxID=55571 RepID=A0ACB7WD27_DIOAL|nr:Uracil-DNA glycosylase protein [Dioscorea alata]